MKTTLKTLRSNPLYLKSLILSGNNKLLDVDNEETRERIRYAQFNTRPITDCPFASEGCKAVCYATKGNHCFPSVKRSRENAYNDSRLPDFSERMIYTIRAEMQSGRYKGNIMRVRIHESGDFYSVQYLRKWIRIWNALYQDRESVRFTFYTKSFKFFLMLTDDEAEIINRGMRSGQIAIDFSTDSTMAIEQLTDYLSCVARFPLANTYTFEEKPTKEKYDHVCDCKDCGRCGKCNKADGLKIVVGIHSASNADMDTFRNNIK